MRVLLAVIVILGGTALVLGSCEKKSEETKRPSLLKHWVDLDAKRGQFSTFFLWKNQETGVEVPCVTRGESMSCSWAEYEADRLKMRPGAEQ